MNSSSERLSKVKLPMASFKQLTLQNINPLKQLSNKLPKGKPSQTNRPQASVPNASTLQTGVKQSDLKRSKGTQIAFNLLLVRPWVLVAGLWLVSILGAAVALEGMISPRRLTMELPEPKAEITSVAEDPFINIEQGTDEMASADTEMAPSAAGPNAVTNTENDSNFPAWPVGALVGTCAAGCLAISRQRAKVRLAAARSRSVSRGESRGQVRKVRFDAEASSRSNKPAQPGAIHKSVKTATPRTVAHPAKARASQSPVVRLTKVAQKNAKPAVTSAVRPAAQGKPKKRRPRPQRVMAAPPKSTAGRVLISRSTAQQAAPTSRVSRPQPVKRVAAHTVSRQSVVSVVPASESHSLDWTEGSLAHKMDVRPQRSVSSL